MEIGKTGKRPTIRSVQKESVAIACGRSTSGSSLDFLGFDDRTKQLAQARFDLRVAGGALAPTPCSQGNHSLGHIAMPAGATDFTEQSLHGIAGIFRGLIGR